MTTFVSKYLKPDPLIFAVLLTALSHFVCAWGLTDSTPVDLVNMWGNGFWNLLGFGMQMALSVVTGNVLATSPANSWVSFYNRFNGKNTSTRCCL